MKRTALVVAFLGSIIAANWAIADEMVADEVIGDGVGGRAEGDVAAVDRD